MKRALLVVSLVGALAAWGWLMAASGSSTPTPNPPATLGLYSSEPRFVDAGQAVLADGAYTDTLPCLPDEGSVQGCVNGRIRVRAFDGAHFAKSGSGYSAGGRRFADAIDEAVARLR
jgi:hypothetical protein